MQTLTTNFNRLALYLAYKAGHLTWQQLPLTTQTQCIVASSWATYAGYKATMATKPAAVAWCSAAMARTGGTHLTGSHPTVTPAGNPASASNHGHMGAGKAGHVGGTQC